ncbi:MAG: hypothetical protein KatS3mg031_3021 [Chitinophagales bacterium]|nr:MAG: hypothetical protein KatS3mg031_3021 [Chitinophagales bacterium]
MKTLTLILSGIVLSLILIAQTSAEQELAHVNAQLSKSPNDIKLLYQRADLYDQQNDFDRANNDYKKIIELYNKKRGRETIGEFTKSCYRLADDYFFRQSDKEQALKYIQEGLKGAPGLKDLEILQAVVIGSDAARQQEADALFLSLTEKYPNDARLLRYYARFLKDKDPLRAAQYYEKTVSLNPQDIESLLMLGTIYNNEASRLSAPGSREDKDSGSPAVYMKKSIRYFEQAQRLIPDDPEVKNILKVMYTELPAEKPNLPY